MMNCRLRSFCVKYTKVVQGQGRLKVKVNGQGHLLSNVIHMACPFNERSIFKNLCIKVQLLLWTLNYFFFLY